MQEICRTSIKVLGLASRCYKVCSYSYRQSICTKCVSEILKHRLTIKKEYSVAKLETDLGKYEQRYKKVSAIIVAKATY